MEEQQKENITYRIKTLNAYLHILKSFTEENQKYEEIEWINVFLDEIIRESNMLICSL